MAVVDGWVCVGMAAVAVAAWPLKRWREARDRRQRQAVQIKRIDADGFVAGGVDVAWSDVRRVGIFKHDCLVFDLIVVWFAVTDGAVVQVDEDDPRFGPLMAEVERRLPAFPTDWYAEVVQPPMVPNDRILWAAGPV